MSLRDISLEVRILVFLELDMPLLVERPSLDGLEALLVYSAPKAVTVVLRSGTSPFGRLVLPGPL